MATVLQIKSARGEEVDCDVLIASLGRAPDPPVINVFATLNPKYLVLLYSEDSGSFIEKVHSALVPGYLSIERIDKKLCNATDAADIYQQIRKALEELKSKRKEFSCREPRTILDITGGTKVMSAAAALAAWRMNLTISYIESPPGGPTSQQPGCLILLDNPIEIFKEEALTDAMRSFDSGRFASAQKSFGELSQQLSDPTRARFMASLAGFYCAWSDLDFDLLEECGAQLKENLRNVFRLKLLSESVKSRLERQIDFVADLKSKQPFSHLLNFYLLGRHYSSTLQRFDFAALFYYRCIEGCFVQRLRDLEPCFQGRNIDYSTLKTDKGGLLERYNAITKDFGWPPANDLPVQLGFMNSAALLKAFDDKLNKNGGYSLAELERLSDIRNQSILAHGDKPIAESDSRKLESKAFSILKNLALISNWKLPEKHLEATIDELLFLKSPIA